MMAELIQGFPPGYLDGRMCVYCKHMKEDVRAVPYLWGCNLATFFEDARESSPWHNNCDLYEPADDETQDKRSDRW